MVQNSSPRSSQWLLKNLGASSHSLFSMSLESSHHLFSSIKYYISLLFYTSFCTALLVEYILILKLWGAFKSCWRHLTYNIMSKIPRVVVLIFTRITLRGFWSKSNRLLVCSLLIIIYTRANSDIAHYFVCQIQFPTTHLIIVLLF